MVLSDTQPNNWLLQAQDIYKRYGKRIVLTQVNISIEPEEIVTIIGPNGSGKTTLLKILLGLEAPTSGVINRSPELRVGYVPQQITFSPVLPFTVKYFLQNFCKSKSKLAAISQELGITNLLNRQIYSLSGGQIQRVMLAQSLLNEPNLLVLDEPVQGVDFAGQAQIYRLIKHISKQHKCAVLMVSHDLHLVMSGTDKVICLNRHICCSGTPQAVSKDPEFVNMFGRDIANQIALYIHHHDHQHSITGEVIKNE